MEILHISFSDNGGAGIAAYRLHRGLRDRGYSSQMLVARKTRDDAYIRQPEYPRALPSRLRRYLARQANAFHFRNYRQSRPSGYEIFAYARNHSGLLMLDAVKSADIIHLHWISEFIDYPSFFGGLDQKIPIVWTMHDMNPFTGGCHYDLECGRYRNLCGACPQLGSSIENDLSRSNYLLKMKCYRKRPHDRLCFVSPSRWMYEQLQTSPMAKEYSCKVIPNGIDTDIFRPLDKAAARESLGIDSEGKTVLFIADSVANKRKGFVYLLKALKRMEAKVKGLQLITVGSATADFQTGLPHISFGYVASPRLLAIIYSAADVFAIPSIQDNLPNTILESVACGTPVVGFNSGGIAEVVREGETGLSVPAGNIEEFAEALESLLTSSSNELSMKCRIRATDEYNVQFQVERYLSLYKDFFSC